MATRPDATTEQLRNDIDHGRTGAKVRAPDPAVAPLGTDEEAAGTRIDPQVIAQTREVEAKMAPPTDDQRSQYGPLGDILWWFAVVGAMIAWAGVAWWLTSLGD